MAAAKRLAIEGGPKAVKARLGHWPQFDAATVNQLFILTLPAHLQKIEGRVLEPKQRDIVRANFIRETLGER